MGFLGVSFDLREGERDKITSCLKLVRIMLETLNLVRKGGFFSDKTVFTIYADLESLIKKID